MTRAEIEKDPWFGNQRAAVLALLDRAEKAERVVEAAKAHVEDVIAHLVVEGDDEVSDGFKTLRAALESTGWKWGDE